jgi:hypothetical protein
VILNLTLLQRIKIRMFLNLPYASGQKKAKKEDMRLATEIIRKIKLTREERSASILSIPPNPMMPQGSDTIMPHVFDDEETKPFEFDGSHIQKIKDVILGIEGASPDDGLWSDDVEAQVEALLKK